MDALTPYSEPIFPSMEPYRLAAQAGESGLGPTKMRMMNLKRNALQKAYLRPMERLRFGRRTPARRHHPGRESVVRGAAGRDAEEFLRGLHGCVELVGFQRVYVSGHVCG